LRASQDKAKEKLGMGTDQISIEGKNYGISKAIRGEKRERKDLSRTNPLLQLSGGGWQVPTKDSPQGAGTAKLTKGGPVPRVSTRGERSAVPDGTEQKKPHKTTKKKKRKKKKMSQKAPEIRKLKTGRKKPRKG